MSQELEFLADERGLQKTVQPLSSIKQESRSQKLVPKMIAFWDEGEPLSLRIQSLA